MKTIGIEQANFDRCLQDAQEERVIITRDGRPIAMIVGLEGSDDESAHEGEANAFWSLIAERRQQPSVDRATLERVIEGRSDPD